MKHANTSFILQMLFIFCCLTMLFAPSSADAKIVFIYNGSIYVMNDDGSGIRRLTDNQFWEWEPRWSPDGTQIAFERNLEKDRQKWQLFLMNADGTNQQQLTHNGDGEKNGAPAWSPDGQHLAFDSNRSGRAEIYVMDLQNRTVKQLTGIEKESGSYSPDWSPDGKQIVYGRFVRKPAGLSHKNIYVMDSDGKNQRPLLPDPPENAPSLFRSYPHWAPDGKQILFLESREKQGQKVKRFVIQRENGRRTEIDMNPKIGGSWVGSGACWMDNGRAILFSAGRLDVPEKEEYHDIYRYEIEGGKLRRLTKHRYHDIQPDWVEGPLPVSPQGKLPTCWSAMKTLYGLKMSAENRKSTAP